MRYIFFPKARRERGRVKGKGVALGPSDYAAIAHCHYTARRGAAVATGVAESRDRHKREKGGSDNVIDAGGVIDFGQAWFFACSHLSEL